MFYRRHLSCSLFCFCQVPEVSIVDDYAISAQVYADLGPAGETAVVITTQKDHARM